MGRSPEIKPLKTCMYCGNPVQGVRRGEHIIQQALGGTLTLACVCQGCNNRTSEIDKELVSRSPLSLVAWETTGNTEEDVWDYNAEFDVALEARLLKKYAAPVLWPQVVLEAKGPMFHADLEEVQKVGPQIYLKKFLLHLTRARNTLRDGSKRPRWIWEPVAQPPRRGRLPPRVYSRHSFDELSDKVHFQCKYLGHVDKKRILWSLDNWRPFERRMQFKECFGVRDPEAQCSFQPRCVMRALVKIGINLLAYVCKETVVSQDTFPEACSFVLHEDASGPCQADCGFVVNKDIRGLECPEKCHRFRLTHTDHWCLDCAFFGGRIGATVAFQGPSGEPWARADITVPLGSNKWTINTSPIFLPRRMRVEWKDWSKVVPSVPIGNVETHGRVESSRKRT